LLEEGFDSPGAASALTALGKLVLEKNVKLSGSPVWLGSYLSEGNPETIAAACKLAGALHAPELLARLATVAKDTEAPQPLRLAAFEGLSRYSAGEAKDALLEAARAAEQTDTRTAAALGLVRNFRSDSVAELRTILVRLNEPSAAQAFWKQVLSFSGLAADLAKSFKAEPLAGEVAALHLPAVRCHERANSRKHPPPCRHRVQERRRGARRDDLPPR
jgi:hypothetical protein